jgi:hypothetical protein
MSDTAMTDVSSPHNWKRTHEFEFNDTACLENGECAFMLCKKGGTGLHGMVLVPPRLHTATSLH